jgi:hypothetical protein
MKKSKILKFLAEGMLIIVSVLVAFLIEEYRDSRNERESCATYLKALREDLVRDTVYLKRRIADFDSILVNSDLLLNVSEWNDPLPGWFYKKDNINFEEALYGVLLPINFQNHPVYESMKSNGDLKLIRDLELQVALNHHYSRAEFAELTVNSELKRITQARRDFIHHSELFGLRDFNAVDEGLAKRILANRELHTIVYDSRQVIATALRPMREIKQNSGELIKKIDQYLSLH